MKHKYIIIIICVCFAVTGMWYLSFLKNNDIKVDSTKMETAEYTPNNTDLTQKSNTSKPVSKVCISGEVLNPGVYDIEEGERIADVIEKAGGTTEDADLYGLNLSKYVNDEDNIVIPKKSVSVDKNEVSTQNNNISTLININNADKESLMSLDGIGEKIAEAIIAYRNENNGFKTVDEIKNINRIGDGVYNKIKDKITV